MDERTLSGASGNHSCSAERGPGSSHGGIAFGSRRSRPFRDLIFRSHSGSVILVITYISFVHLSRVSLHMFALELVYDSSLYLQNIHLLLQMYLIDMKLHSSIEIRS